jgi:hypothetical protein
MHTNVEYTITPPGRTSLTAWSNILLWYVACFFRESIVTWKKWHTKINFYITVNLNKFGNKNLFQVFFFYQ